MRRGTWVFVRGASTYIDHHFATMCVYVHLPLPFFLPLTITLTISLTATREVARQRCGMVAKRHSTRNCMQRGGEAYSYRSVVNEQKDTGQGRTLHNQQLHLRRNYACPQSSHEDVLGVKVKDLIRCSWCVMQGCFTHLDRGLNVLNKSSQFYYRNAILENHSLYQHFPLLGIELMMWYTQR